jgi:hypothetical protein
MGNILSSKDGSKTNKNLNPEYKLDNNQRNAFDEAYS